MMTTPIDELIIAAYMRALSIAFEGEAASSNRIFTQASIGFDPVVIGERCRLIDAAAAEAIVGIFDPKRIQDGPAFVGICLRDRGMVRLDTGHLWMSSDERAVLIASDGYLKVESGRFVRHSGRPTRDLTQGKARARRKLAELASVRSSEGVLVVSMG
ncbi:hypothetical protein [uncultured Sphingomonas sp.]|uniref:hypothetical protein n=1 Tax=uncultured Sphingomonas sp. TaxID=158754 RepID=UPI00262EABB8|nr:hypothetical protein [uncultured Sphingomonas sp.]